MDLSAVGAERSCEVEQPCRSAVDTEGARRSVDRLRCSRRVESDHMRKDHGMSVGVRKIETPAERMAKLMIERHAYGAQAIAAGHARNSASARGHPPKLRP